MKLQGQGMLMKLMISEIAEFFHLLTSLEKTVTIVTLEMFNSELFALIVETKFFDGKTIPNLAFVYDESLQHRYVGAILLLFFIKKISRDILMQHIIQFQSTAIQLHIGESFPHIGKFQTNKRFFSSKCEIIFCFQIRFSWNWLIGWTPSTSHLLRRTG